MKRRNEERNRMRRAAAAMLLLAMSIIVTSCSGEKRNGNGQQDEFDYLITVGLSVSGEDSEWKTANIESFKSVFIEENGYELLCEDAQLDQEKQIEELKQFIKDEVDYVIFSPVVETGWDEILEELDEARIPVILIQNKIDQEDDSMYRCWLGSDYKKQSRQAVEWLDNYLEEKEKEKTEEEKDEKEKTDEATNAPDGADTTDTEADESDDQLNIAVIQGMIGSFEQTERAEAYQSEISKHTGWNVVAQQTGENTREQGKAVMKLFLEEDAKLDVVFAENDEMALGAAEAIREAGLTCGPEGDVILIAFGGTKEGLQAAADGELNVVFECSPIQAPKAAEIIQKLESGVMVEKNQYVKDDYYESGMELDEMTEKRTY